MSANRAYIDGRPIWVPCDDGATPYRSSRGIRGGIGNPVVFGAFVTGESTRSRDLRLQRESAARARHFVDLKVMETSDNGAVKAPITEVSS